MFGQIDEVMSGQPVALVPHTLNQLVQAGTVVQSADFLVMQVGLPLGL